jgi:hypothetical protein
MGVMVWIGNANVMLLVVIIGLLVKKDRRDWILFIFMFMVVVAVVVVAAVW